MQGSDEQASPRFHVTKTTALKLIGALSAGVLCGCTRAGFMSATDSQPVTALPAVESAQARRTGRVANAEAAGPKHASLVRTSRDNAEHEAARVAFEKEFPYHGVVFHFLAQVVDRPVRNARVIGYMRRGATFRAQGPERAPGCSGGYYAIPGAGYVCRGAGFMIGETPQSFEPSPAPPALADALPYAYARTLRDDVPQYWKAPTREEELEGSRIIGRMREEQEAAEKEDAATAADLPPEETLTRADAVDAPPPPGQRALGETANTTAGLPAFFRMRMLKGFVVSVDRAELVTNASFFRTVRGGFVRSDDLVPATLPRMRGVVLGDSWQLPVAFVFRGGARRYEQSSADSPVRDVGTFDRHTPFVVTNERLVRGNKIYVGGEVGGRSTVAREPAVRVARLVARPSGVPSRAKWIHVSLSSQTLVAYDGDLPVFVTLVSSGKEGFETPTGVFSIQSKHVSTTMDDEGAADGAYSIEDVPWTMYFSGNFALHGAFWHDTFGSVRSHGCVNLAPADARWLFQWSTPILPQSWHGVFSDRARAGTYVVIAE